MRVKVKARIDSNVYERIVHQHLRYAGVIDIDESPPNENAEYIEFAIIPPKGVAYEMDWAKRVAERIKSFLDHAEIERK